MRRASRATSRTKLPSSGLIQATLATPTPTPSAPSCSAAAIATDAIGPLASIRTSLPFGASAAGTDRSDCRRQAPALRPGPIADTRACRWLRSVASRAGFGRVARRKHFHARQRRHDRHVLDGVVRVALAAIGIAAPHGDDLHVGRMMTHVVAQLFEAPERRKISDRIDEDGLAGECDAGRHAGHVLLRHPHIDEPIGKTRGKRLEHGKPEIAAQQPDV